MTNNKQQTAVEWLIEQFWNNEGMLTSKKLEKAKDIEKDQIIEAFDQGVIAEFTHQVTGAPDTSGEQYFNQTYGDEKQ
jgi:hypothetical protein